MDAQTIIFKLSQEIVADLALLPVPSGHGGALSAAEQVAMKIQERLHEHGFVRVEQIGPVSSEDQP